MADTCATCPHIAMTGAVAKCRAMPPHMLPGGSEGHWPTVRPQSDFCGLHPGSDQRDPYEWIDPFAPAKLTRRKGGK